MSKQIIRLCQLRCVVSGADEELTAVCVWPGVRHRHAPLRIVSLHRLIIKLVAWSTRPLAGWIACLNDETRDHAMEDQTVIEVVLCQEDKVIDRMRRE